MIVRIQAARQLTFFSARQKDMEKRCDLEAGMAKLFATEAAMENAAETMRIHGGYGYSKEFRAKMTDLPPDPAVVIGVASNARELIKT